MAEKKSMTYISAEDVSVGYHDLPLIEKIHFHVDRGEILTLTFGYTMIMAETSLGRMTKKSPVGAYQSFGKSKWLSLGGWINAIIRIPLECGRRCRCVTDLPYDRLFHSYVETEGSEAGHPYWHD